MLALVPTSWQPVVSVGPVWAGTCREVTLVPPAAGALPQAVVSGPPPQQAMSRMGHLCVTHTTAPVALADNWNDLQSDNEQGRNSAPPAACQGVASRALSN